MNIPSYLRGLLYLWCPNGSPEEFVAGPGPLATNPGDMPGFIAYPPVPASSTVKELLYWLKTFAINILLQAENLRGFHASVNPTFEGRIPDFMDGITDFMDGITDFMENFSTF